MGLLDRIGLFDSVAASNASNSDSVYLLPTNDAFDALDDTMANHILSVNSLASDLAFASLFHYWCIPLTSYSSIDASSSRVDLTTCSGATVTRFFQGASTYMDYARVLYGGAGQPGDVSPPPFMIIDRVIFPPRFELLVQAYWPDVYANVTRSTLDAPLVNGWNQTLWDLMVAHKQLTKFGALSPRLVMWSCFPIL